MAANLENIPYDISDSYFKESLTRRSREQGYNFCSYNYVHSITITTKANHEIELTGKCYHSMRKNEPPHKMLITISSSEEKVTDSCCSCKAGTSGTCSHVLAFIYTISHFKKRGFKEVPSCQGLSCTSVPQQWHIPRGSKIIPQPVASMVFAKTKREPRKKRPVAVQIPHQSITPVSAETLQMLKEDPATPLSYLLTSELPSESTPHGNVQQGSLLPYHFQNYKKHEAAEHTPCGDLSFPRPNPPDVHLDARFDELNGNCHFDIDLKSATDLEHKTVSQDNSKLWHDERRKRLTASDFSKVAKRKKSISDPLLHKIFRPVSFTSAATSYGNCHEEIAKEAYVNKYPERHLHECGLVINPSFPFLGASPDGKVCVDGSTGILEVKCPYSARDMLLKDAVHLKNFCLVGNGCDLKLKENHDFYYQVQGQLLITGASFCEFVVYTKKDLSVDHILPNKEFQQNMLNKLAAFYMDYGIPYLNF